MKKWFPILWVILAIGCTPMREPGLQSAPSPTPMTVIIDFQTGFTGNWVQLSFNEEQIFSGELKTDERIGRAKTLRHAAPGPTFDMSATVDRSKTYHFKVSLDRGLYLGVSKNLDNGSIQLSQNKEPFLYD